MKILVTGGAGFIGSNFIRYILQTYSNVEIINLDKLTYAGNLENLTDLSEDPRYAFKRGDICDSLLVEEILGQGITHVVNFAAESHVDRSIVEPGIFIKTNVLGTQVLLDLANQYDIEKYVQVSTDEVYGSLGPMGLFTEKTPLAPNSPYSASKASADLMVRAYHHTFGLPVNITRCSNNYGPYQFPEKLIPLMIGNALHDQVLPVYGDGLNIRDWLYVEDHCRAIDLVLREGKPGEVYNIGGNSEKTNLEIVRTILSLVGKDESLIRYVKDRPGHDRRYAIDSSKIQTQLGWLPKYTFQEGVELTVRWYLESREWWERIRSGAYQEYYQQMYADRVAI